MNQGQISPSRERKRIEIEKDEKARRQGKKESTKAQDRRNPEKYQAICAVRA
jgi:hypothetical protein